MQYAFSVHEIRNKLQKKLSNISINPDAVHDRDITPVKTYVKDKEQIFRA